MSRWMSVLLLAGAVTLAGGCATGADPIAMTATETVVKTRHPGTVSITVTGGSETSATGPMSISNADFEAALRESILRSKLFAEVLASGGAYTLQAYLVRIDHPMFGASMTSNVEVEWTLIDARTKQRVWQKSLPTSGTAAWNAAFAGVTRVKMSVEAAARQNIEAALRSMGELDLR